MAFAADRKAANEFRAFTPVDATEVVNRRATEAFDMGDLEAAMDMQISNLATADGNPRQRARIMHELGLLCNARDRLDDAEQWLLKSLAIKESSFGAAEAVRTLLALGELEVQRHRDDEAEMWFLRVREIANAEESTATEAMIRLAGIAWRRGDSDAALNRVLQAFWPDQPSWPYTARSCRSREKPARK